MILAFFKLDDHHSSRSLVKEPAELLEAFEVPVDGGLLVRSLAFLSLRAPTVSASFSNGRSVANMLNYRCGDAAGCSGATLNDDPKRRGQNVDWGLFVNQTQSYRGPMQCDADTL